MDFDLDNIDFDEAEQSVEKRRDEIDNETRVDNDDTACEGCTI